MGSSILKKTFIIVAGVCLLTGILRIYEPVSASSTINVNTYLDQYNSGAECSLREAIYASNTDTAFGGCAAGSGSDTIILRAGDYHLTISEGSVDQTGKGDLDITDDLTISGQTDTHIIVDFNMSTRVFHVKSPTDLKGKVIRVIHVTFSNLEITGGSVNISNDPQGGGGSS